ncbi:MFS general substrate transporter [Trematosphaeria pertusa]|uniref:MFS general substrate transporter n=1 Tax=Trematosphaeria pertusa TaxID=390896 RepID=A0A6A6IQE7_9PLEO|nr:MFS general substrate transporter [Trematosphaeria pertusa]KAF2251992.1 MFS general substrate transporter [Trematosphaeria pertusa]
MGLGVLNDAHMAAPPGTVKIGATATVEDPAEDASSLKRDGDIILQPQPSDNPNDPLNWSRAWKESIMVILAFSSGVTTALGPMITPGIQVVSMKYGVSLDMVSSLLIGFLAFWIGFTTFFTASGANIWGKRPFFVISALVLLATNVWGFFSSSFPSLAAMRILQGIASAPLETLVTSTVSDMYFVHQRGTRLSIWGCMLASGVLLGQTISGAIIQNISFEATFGISALIFIPIVLLMYFVVVETTYNGPRGGSKIEIEEKGSFWTVDTDEKETYAQKLRLFRGRISGESFWKGAWKPVPLIAYPAVLFSTVVYGSYFTWLLTISVLSVTAFSMPPYNLNPAQIGLTNLPLLGVALIGSPISGWMADAAAKFMARRNGGIFEPEFRLTLMLVATPLATAGFLGFGMSVQNGAPLQWPILFMAIHSLSVPFASQASLTYVIDCHPKDANQAFVTINFTKAVFTFMATTYANGWFLKVGPRGVFDVITLINLGVCCLTIPAYIFGKRFRSMVARSSFGQKLSG